MLLKLLMIYIVKFKKRMNAGQIKAFGVKVKSLNRVLKEYKNYKIEVDAYDLNLVSQDKKQQ